MKLSLGVLDILHPTSAGLTTGDLAEILEEKYHIMAIFFAKHSAEIAGFIEVAMADALEDMLSGGGGGISLKGAESAIEVLFRAFIAGDGLDGLAPGVPTEAALKGVSHRRMHPYARRGPRPSFVDTGTYVAAFRAWTEGGEEALRGFGTGPGVGRAASAEGEATEADLGDIIAGVAEL